MRAVTTSRPRPPPPAVPWGLHAGGGPLGSGTCCHAVGDRASPRCRCRRPVRDRPPTAEGQCCPPDLGRYKAQPRGRRGAQGLGWGALSVPLGPLTLAPLPDARCLRLTRASPVSAACWVEEFMARNLPSSADAMCHLPCEESRSFPSWPCPSVCPTRPPQEPGVCRPALGQGLRPAGPAPRDQGPLPEDPPGSPGQGRAASRECRAVGPRGAPQGRRFRAQEPRAQVSLPR